MREKTAEEKEAEEAAADAEDEAQVINLYLLPHNFYLRSKAKYNEFNNYKQMVELMRPGESVAKSLRRLGGGQKVNKF